jgi:hypothetical protein
MSERVPASPCPKLQGDGTRSRATRHDSGPCDTLGNMPEPSLLAWSLPVLSAAIEKREEIATVWRQVQQALGLKQSLVAITGLSGSGKSTLIDDFEGKTGIAGYKPPNTSLDTDEGKVGSRRTRRVKLLAIPGVNATARTTSINEVFEGKPLAGIIHVVSDGYPLIRESVAREQMIQDRVGSPADLRELSLHEEVEDLAFVGELVRRHFAKHRKRLFFSVLVNKYDLYHHGAGGAEVVRKHYHLLGSSRFGTELASLRAIIGSDNLLVDTDPIAAWPEKFEWNGHVVDSRLSREDRDILSIRYLKKLTEMVRSVE